MTATTSSCGPISCGFPASTDEPAHRQAQRPHPTWNIAIAAYRTETGHALANVLQAGTDELSIELFQPPLGRSQDFSLGDPDLLLLQNELIEQPAESYLTRLLEEHPAMRILVFGADMNDDYLCRLVGAGAHGYFQLQTASDTVRLAVDQVMAGNIWMQQQAIGSRACAPRSPEELMAARLRSNIDTLCEELTRREKEILCQVIRGYAIKQIAAEVHLSHQGVKMHLARLFRKFEASNRNQLILAVLDRISPVEDLSLSLCEGLRSNLIETPD